MLVRFSHQLRDLLSSWRLYPTAIPAKRAPIPVLLASLWVTAFLLGLRQLGVLQPMELWAYDHLLRNRPKEAPDPRILVVGVTEEDLQQVGRFPLPDATLAQLLEKLQRYQPRAIGLDIYRDLAVEPGHDRLAKRLNQSDRIVAICKMVDRDDPGVAPPPSVPANRVSFSDLVVDADGVVRRALLFASPTQGKCLTPFSFSFQMARRYLEKEGIQPMNPPPGKQVQLGKAVFPPLEADSGSYQGIDARGYQLLLNYRSADAVAQQVTLSQVLNNQIQPEWVRDRIVLIGTTAPSVRDIFNTPYSAGKQQQRKMPGVVIHAQMVSQILSSALDNRPLLWYMPQWGEMLWVWGWSLVGGFIVWRLRHPLGLSLVGMAALGSLVGIAYGLLIVGGWIPLVPPILALVATGGTVVVSIAYQMQQQQEKVAQLAREQEQTIALLTTMVKEETKKVGVGEWETIDNAPTAPIPNFAEAKAAIASLSSPHPAIPAPNDSLDGRYQIVSILGKGGFGQTYLAQDTKRPGNPTCVVKYLMPARRDTKFLEVARRLFETEAKILEALGRHSQIPQLLAYFEANEEFYLVEEYIEGYPLSDVLFADKRLSEAQVVDILTGVLEVLAFIHKHHVIHRDIKPSNIIRSKQDGMLILIDFGAVKQMQPQLDGETENPTVAIGTRGYAPAEQYAGHPRPNSDIYALGMIAIQALTGIFPQQLPQDRDTGNVVWRDLANVNEELARILDKMVQYHFSDRYQSAAEVLQALNHLDRATLSAQPSDLRKIPDRSPSERLNLSDSSDVSDSTVQDHRD